jgi:uncharacterized protein YoxC
MLKSLLLLAGIFALLALTCLFVVTTFEVHKTFDQTNRSLVQITKDVDDLKVMTNATLFQISDASHEVAVTAREQKKYWDQTSRGTVAAIGKLNKVLADVDAATLHVDQQIDPLFQRVDASLEQIPATLQGVQETLDASTHTIKHLDGVISDPAIPQTLAHVNQTSANVEATTKKVDAAVARLTKPQSLIKSLFSSLLGIAANFAQIFK